MKLLVLTTEPVSAARLREALPADAEPAEVMLIAPALHRSALRFWVSDADEAIARAEEVRHESLQQLGEDGVSASSDTGEGDPLDAIEDALSTFEADRIVVFRHPEGQQRYREDFDAGELRERFGLPVDVGEISDSAG